MPPGTAGWDGWQPREIDIGGGWPSPRDPLNEELPRPEFVLTALGFPLLTGLRGLGTRFYHRALARLVPVLSSHRFRAPPPSIEQYAATSVRTLRRELQAGRVSTAGVRLQIEPGRSMYGDAGIHLARVKAVKRQSQPFPHAWALTDTTTFFLAGGHFERNRFRHVVANKADQPQTTTADLVGHSCFADQIIPGARLPAVVPGDVIALLDTRAYQESSASNFNALPRPATVMVRGTEAAVVRRAETVQDVYSRDLVPSWTLRPAGGWGDPVDEEPFACIAPR